VELFSTGSLASASENSSRKKNINITKKDAALLKAPHPDERLIVT
jgi:hypothetical protein